MLNILYSIILFLFVPSIIVHPFILFWTATKPHCLHTELSDSVLPGSKFFRSTYRNQPPQYMFTPVGKRNQNKDSKSKTSCFKMPHRIYTERWNRVLWLTISGTGCTKHCQVLQLAFRTPWPVWCLAREALEEKHQRSHDGRQGSCDIWRCIVHPIPLIVTH